MAELILLLFVAFILDLLIGDPPYPYHPVRIMGRGISFLEKGQRRLGWDGRGGGIALVLILGAFVLGGYLVCIDLLARLHPWVGLCFNLFLCYSCLALGDLFNHAGPIIHHLEARDLDRARKSIAMVVGRDVQGLEERALARAAVETMAENFVDGFLSPLFWYLAGGTLWLSLGKSPLTGALSFMLLFKLASTLDSMVGYKNRRYLYFGWAGARLDDFMNFIPARLSVFFLFLGAVATRSRAFEGLKIAIRDRRKHDSPNAGHAESFLAGALGIRLGGPTRYPEGLKDKPWLGDGEAGAGTGHIRQTVSILRYSAWTATIAPFGLFFFYL
jgi:adenosylcobinamide-phosphate synthase